MAKREGPPPGFFGTIRAVLHSAERTERLRDINKCYRSGCNDRAVRVISLTPACDGSIDNFGACGVHAGEITELYRGMDALLLSL